MPKAQPGLPFILFTVFLDTLGIGIVIPALPPLIATMEVNPEARVIWYGAMLSCYGLAQFVFAPALGALSDRYGRRPIILLALTGFAATFFLTAISPVLWLLMIARLIGGATGGSYSIAGAYIADISPPEERAKNFGVMGAAFGMGFICGPLFGGFLSLHNVRLPYFVAAGLCVVNVAYGFFILPESHPRDRQVQLSWSKINPFATLSALGKTAGVAPLVLIYVLAVLPQSILQVTWVPFTQFRFSWDPNQTGFSLFVVGVCAAFGQAVLLRSVLKRLGDLRTVIVALFSSTIAYLLYGIVTEGWMVYCIVVMNLFAFLANPALQALISRSVPADRQGVTMGSLNSIISVTGVLAPFLSTPILAAVQRLPRTDLRVGATFFLAATIQAIALFRVLLYFRKDRQRSQALDDPNSAEMAP